MTVGRPADDQACMSIAQFIEAERTAAGELVQPHVIQHRRELLSVIHPQRR
jgi:hypothetical protein